MLRLKKKKKKLPIKEFFLNKEKINNVCSHWSLKKNKLFNKRIGKFFLKLLSYQLSYLKKNNDIKLHWDFFYAMVVVVLLIRIRHFS